MTEVPEAFPVMVTQMIGVGEETGALETMMTKVADFYEEQVEAAVKALTSILEPIMIVVVGAIVGFIVIAMYLPMFKVYRPVQVGAPLSPSRCPPCPRNKAVRLPSPFSGWWPRSRAIPSPVEALEVVLQQHPAPPKPRDWSPECREPPAHSGVRTRGAPADSNRANSPVAHT